MPRLTVRPVTAQNWLDVLALEVHATQRLFVASVERSLARAYIQPFGYTYEPMAIQVGNSLVGFYCLVYRPSDLSHCVLHNFFIDQRYQQRGYGRAFLEHFLAHLRRQTPLYGEVLLTVHPDNQVALRLYTIFGFVKTGRLLDGEEEMRLPLS